MMLLKHTTILFGPHNKVFNNNYLGFTPFLICSSQRNFSTYSAAYSPITPVKVYANAGVEKVQIFAENHDKAGVYRWVNKINGNSYVGCSIDLGRRFYQYFNINHLKRNTCMRICRALLKYGYSNFKLEILKYCNPAKSSQLEQFYLDLLKPEYNILKLAGSSLGFRRSEETRAKISAYRKGKYKGENSPLFGKTPSEETSAKLSSSMMGNSNSKNNPNSIKIQVTDLELNTSTIYNSMGEAARALNIGIQGISLYFKNNQKKPLKGRYVFRKL